MKQVNVALIDSGVSISSHDFFKKNRNRIEGIEEGFFNPFDDKVGHGTAISYILLKYGMCDKLYIINIFDDNESTNEEYLIKALNYVLNYLNVDVLNLSNGITMPKYKCEIYSLCESLNKKGVIILSAFHNNGVICYPAAFNNVISVYYDKYLKKPQEYIYVENSPVNILGYCSKQRLPWKGCQYKNVDGTSFIVPHITNNVVEMLKEGVLKYRIRDKLKEKSIRQIKLRDNYIDTVLDLNIKKAVVFPYQKETDVLFRNQDLLNFEIVKVYDFSFRGNIGKKFDNTFVENYRNFDASINFDTLILGHVNELSKILETDLLLQAIQFCIKHKKNMYCFDSLERYQDIIKANENIIKFISASDYHKKYQIQNNSFNCLNKFSNPIVAVCGTSSKQGKFTLQLGLRREFMKRGYTVSQLGTEPTSLLFGFDAMVSCGYGSIEDFGNSKSVYLINNLLSKINDKSDITFIGTQSQTIPYSYGNLGFYTFSQHSILLASEPDYVILCVNMYDEMDYIERTIGYIEKYLLSHVGLICLNILNNKNTFTDEQIKSKLYELRKFFSVPTEIINDYKKITEWVIKYFT